MSSRNCLLIVFALACVSVARDYPIYKQCDPQWGEEYLGTSDMTICKGGSLISSIAMGLKGGGFDYNPSTLNVWLT